MKKHSRPMLPTLRTALPLRPTLLPTLLASTLCLSVLSGCRTVSLDPAPVVEHYGSSSDAITVPVVYTPVIKPVAVTTPVNVPVTAFPAAPRVNVNVPTPKSIALPQAVTLGSDKTHVVRQGDTLYSIALEHGLSYRELAEWNGITNPSYIQLDQVLRLTTPSQVASTTAIATASTSSANTGTVVAQTAPIQLHTGSAQPTVTQIPVIVPVSVPATPSINVKSGNGAAVPVVSVPAAPVVPTPTDLTWQWPARGRVITPYSEAKKGIDIAGNLGDGVLAAADGKVVYAGTVLKGYGQMLIIKHNDVYLTAYAHNSKLLVKEEATVKRGQKIAEMGNTESEGGQVKLHFELRRSGKPVDPVKLLPAQ